MSSQYGKIFSISTWGESHGPGLGVVIDGCPAGLELDVEFIQAELDRRRPGQSKLTTARSEADQVEILSGTFEGKTTGTPISMMIRNKDQRSHDYGEMVQLYRPSHADLTYDLKYGFRDYRGGGRSSARETAGRVAAGAIAKQILKQFCGTEILSWVSQIGPIVGDINPSEVTLEAIEANPVRCPDSQAAEKMADLITEVRKDQDSIGGVVQLAIRKPAVGLGEPIFDRMEAELAKAMLSIPASRGFEIGSGFAAASMRGSEHNDAIWHDGQRFRTHTNRAGGTLGGITNGEDILARIAFKPTATISKDQETVSQKGESAILKAKGRHDPCVATRAPVIVEAMAAIVTADLLLRQRAKGFMFET